MEKYIEGNKAAWEEAFENRVSSWGADITDRVRNEGFIVPGTNVKNFLTAWNVMNRQVSFIIGRESWATMMISMI